MKFFGWMQNKLHGKQGNTHRPSISSASSHQPREEFSDWPQGLLSIGTFGSVAKEQTQIQVVQEVFKEENPSDVNMEAHRDQDLSFSGDLDDFTPEEVGKLQKELTKLLTRKNKKRKSDVNRELGNLPLDRFLNCPSSLEVDRRISNALASGGDFDENEEEMERTISVILGRCKAISTESSNKKKKSKRDLIKTSVFYLFKKMFVCSEGLSPLPNPSLRDTFQESRMEKLLRVMLHKKINAQASSKQTSTKRYVEDKQQLSLKNEEEEGRSSDGSKWVKTDSDCEFQIFWFLKKILKNVQELIRSSSLFWLQSLFLRSDPIFHSSCSYKKIQVEDRKYIGGSAYGGKRAKIIHHPSAKDSGWPQVFGVSLSENELSGMLPTRYIQITRTDVYNLCFIHCDLDLKDMVVEGKTIWENAWIIPAFWQLLSF
ncbi:hypothetical protein HID58_072207 [Brassica napus]|uniref:Uncharacterized protein n=2 Tax=Brassica napus TaxID=3708 RepID=A0ABQ7Z3R9_BRANA|nr:hypothetical protein HID58_072207 [Brassica napus]